MVDYNTLEEPFFLINEFLEYDQKELAAVAEEIKKRPKEYESKAIFLKNFLNELCKAHRKEIYIDYSRKKDDESIKKELIEKRKELVSILNQLKQKPIQEILPEQAKKDMKDINVEIPKPAAKLLITKSITDTEYNIIEPELSEDEKNILSVVKLELGDYDEQKLQAILKSKSADQDQLDKLKYFIAKDISIFGKISSLLDDPDITEIVCDGSNQEISVHMADGKLLKTNLVFTTDQEINDQLTKIAKQANINLSQENPFIDAPISTNFFIQANLGTEFIAPRFVIKRI